MWSTYFGSTLKDFDEYTQFYSRSNITFDGQNNLYISGTTLSTDLSTTGVFQENKGTSSQFISKIDINGNRIWTSYYGLNTYIGSLQANTTALYVSGFTTDCPPNYSYNTYYGTLNSFKPIPSNCRDIYLSKFNIDGQRVWSTYYGGNSGETNFNNSISLLENKIFISGISPNYTNQEVATTNSFQPNCNGASNFIAQFNEDGTRNWGSYNGNIGNNNTTSPSSIYTDVDGSYYNYGSTGLIDIATTNAFKTQLSNNYYQDAFVCKFDINNNKVWGTYYGGDENELNVKFHPYSNSNGENFYLLGSTYSLNNISTPNSLQPNKTLYDTANNTLASVTNIFISHFEPITLSNITFNQNSFSIYPNPNNGNFTISLKNNVTENYTLELFDILGKKLKTQKLNNSETNIQMTNLSKGIYIAKITNFENISYSSKIVVE